MAIKIAKIEPQETRYVKSNELTLHSGMSTQGTIFSALEMTVIVSMPANAGIR